MDALESRQAKIPVCCAAGFYLPRQWHSVRDIHQFLCYLFYTNNEPNVDTHRHIATSHHPHPKKIVDIFLGINLTLSPVG